MLTNLVNVKLGKMKSLINNRTRKSCFVEDMIKLGFGRPKILQARLT